MFPYFMGAPESMIWGKLQHNQILEESQFNNFIGLMKF